MRLASIVTFSLMGTTALSESASINDIFDRLKSDRVQGVTTTLYTDPLIREINVINDLGFGHFGGDSEQDNNKSLQKRCAEHGAQNGYGRAPQKYNDGTERAISGDNCLFGGDTVELIRPMHEEVISVVNEINGFGGTYKEEVMPDGYGAPLPVEQVITAELDLSLSGQMHFFLAPKNYRFQVKRKLGHRFKDQITGKIDNAYALPKRGITFHNERHDVPTYFAETIPLIGGVEGAPYFMHSDKGLSWGIEEALPFSFKPIYESTTQQFAKNDLEYVMKDTPRSGHRLVIPNQERKQRAKYTIKINNDIVSVSCNSFDIDNIEFNLGTCPEFDTDDNPKMDSFNNLNSLHKHQYYEAGRYSIEVDIMAPVMVDDYDLYAFGKFTDGTKGYLFLTDDLYTNKVDTQNENGDISYISKITRYEKDLVDEYIPIATIDNEFDAIPVEYRGANEFVRNGVDDVKDIHDVYFEFEFIPVVAGEYYFEPYQDWEWGVSRGMVHAASFTYKTASSWERYDPYISTQNPETQYAASFFSECMKFKAVCKREFLTQRWRKLEKIVVSPDDVGKKVTVRTHPLWGHLGSESRANIEQHPLSTVAFNFIWRVKTPNNTGFLLFNNFNRDL